MNGTLSEFIASAASIGKRYLPEILTGVGIGTGISAVIFSAEATPKAITLIEEKKKEEQKEKLSVKETVAVAWKPYIPAAVAEITSVSCIIAASVINHRRIESLVGACALSASALKEANAYHEKVKEVVGRKKENDIHDEYAKEKMEKDSVVNKEVILTNKGDTLCYDIFTGRYFKSDIEFLKKTANILNRRMLSEEFVSLNDLYDEIDIPRTKLGDRIGWHIDKGYLDFRFSSQLAADGTPCLVIDYQVPPMYDFDKLW